MRLLHGVRLMNRRLLTLAVALAIIPAAALAQEAVDPGDDPCANALLAANEVGLPYQTHCVAFTTDGPPVQTLVVSKTEDAWGDVTATVILLVRQPNGTPVVEPYPFLVENAGNLELGAAVELPA